MLQYDWVKILGMIVVAIIVWELIFTVSAVRWGEKLTARVDLDALWSSTQMRIQAARLTAMFKKADEEGGIQVGQREE